MALQAILRQLMTTRIASAGRVAYHGPREEVLPFFSSLGFSPPKRKGIADFLQGVTSKEDQQVNLRHCI